MRIPAPNFTQTPNDLIDHWLPKLGHAELKVLLVIIRKTFGWHKCRDQISLSQLENITGLQRRHVVKAVKGLVEKGLIIKQVEGPESAQMTFYELVVIEDSNNFTQCPKDTPPSVLKTPTKETPTKEKRKESSLTGAKEKAAKPPPPPPESFYKEKFDNKIIITKEQRDKLLEKYGGMETLLDQYAEKLYRYSLTNPERFNKYRRHDLVIENWIDKDLNEDINKNNKKNFSDNNLNDVQQENWNKNQSLVQEMKLKLSHKCDGLWFYYKTYSLRDKNNKDVDISGLVNHEDFRRYLEKKFNIKISD